MAGTAGDDLLAALPLLLALALRSGLLIPYSFQTDQNIPKGVSHEGNACGDRNNNQ